MSVTPSVLVAGPLVPGSRVAIGEGTLHHLQRVLRLRDGAPLRVTDGAGAHATATLERSDALVGDDVLHTPAPAPRIVLAQALAKGRRADDAVPAACELGVDGLVPVVAARTQGRPDADAAAAVRGRWHGLAVSALEQSRGSHLADVAAPVTIAELAGPHAGPLGGPLGGPLDDADLLRLVAVPGATPLPELLRGDPVRVGVPTTVVVAVGPEGGWAPEELEMLAAGGWLAAGLGPSVLRTEHAGPVAVAATAALLGRWEAAPDATLDPRPSRSPGTL